MEESKTMTKDEVIDKILNSMEYEKEYDFYFLWRQFDDPERYNGFVDRKLCHDEMVFEDLMKSKPDYPNEYGIGDPIYLVKLDVRGVRIKKTGGWLKYKQNKKNKRIRKDVITWGTFVLAGLSLIVPIYCSNNKPIANTKPGKLEAEPLKKGDSTNRDSLLKKTQDLDSNGIY